MAAYNKFNVYTTNLDNAVYNYTSHTFKAMLSNTLPTAANAVKADITEISAGNGYSAGGMTLDSVAVSTSGGTAKVTVADEVLTASGAIGPFRYVVLYDDTPTSPADPLICWFDYGSSITMANGDTFTIDFDATNGLNQTV